MQDLFDKQRLNPGQLRAVGERRLDDAAYLLKSGQNKYANGAIYLAGIAVECLLKGKLLQAYPQLARPDEYAHWDAAMRARYQLLVRWHDLQGIIDQLPDLSLKMAQAGHRHKYQATLAIVCQWSIFIRYSPRTATIGHAADFVAKVREFKQWLT